MKEIEFEVPCKLVVVEDPRTHEFLFAFEVCLN